MVNLTEKQPWPYRTGKYSKYSCQSPCKSKSAGHLTWAWEDNNLDFSAEGKALKQIYLKCLQNMQILLGEIKSHINLINHIYFWLPTDLVSLFSDKFQKKLQTSLQLVHPTFWKLLSLADVMVISSTVSRDYHVC